MECNWKCNSQHGMTSSCRFNWAPWTTNLFSLKSVFPKIRVRTWVQVVFCQNNKPLICWPIRSSNFRGLCFWQETPWTHVLTRISEKTDFSKIYRLKGFDKIRQFENSWMLKFCQKVNLSTVRNSYTSLCRPLLS